ncbi:DMT family transporter [Dissulfurimicrobium hydrothermale]|uniref:DMT family transporter n=1 Tax=Dissulfurimicrobium hydrothermale TaxID=1750598 RepID=UPI001EDA0069|nr:DMT family transporter [Dissulfurimicrobium hydrothermale]UKL13597.1 DMT family transporter [Dissulfurimicrobium hydrothermale]
MNWLPLALLTAFSTATTDVVIKARFAHLSPQDMMAIRAAAPVPFLLLPLMFMPWPKLTLAFWETLSILLPLEIFALFFYMKAIKTSPLSLSVPFLAFTPAFTVLTGWLILGERINLRGMVGILFTVAGAYLLHFRSNTPGVLQTLRIAIKDGGSRLMFFVSAVYSVTSVLGKKAVSESGPFFFACFYFVILGLATIMIFCVIPGVFRWCLRGRPRCRAASAIMGGWRALIAAGFSQSVMVVSHMWAIHLVAAAYMIAVKRTSAIFSVLYGRFVFSEDETLKRLIGAGLMTLGVALIMITD